MDNPIKEKRKRSTETDDNSVRSTKRAPRKRAVRKRASRSKTEPEKKKTEVASKSDELKTKAKLEAKPVSEVESAKRKAPTPIAEKKAKKKFKHKRLVIVGVVMIIGIGASAMVGVTDSGQINVQLAVEQRNERIRNNQASENDTITSNVEIPVQNTNSNKASNNIRGLGIADTDNYRQGDGGDPKPVEPDIATSTDEMASTTDQTASSTDEVNNETETASSSESESANESDNET